MLPTEQLYWDSYAIKRPARRPPAARPADGEEHLDETYDAWHRLLAVSQALYGGVNYDEMRMPAYGGSLLDPDRFPWLHATDEPRAAAQGLRPGHAARPGVGADGRRQGRARDGSPSATSTSSRSATSTKACSATPAPTVDGRRRPRPGRQGRRRARDRRSPPSTSCTTTTERRQDVRRRARRLGQGAPAGGQAARPPPQLAKLVRRRASTRPS